MIRLVFFLEERSAEEMIKGLLPRLLPDHLSSRCIVFEGKQDLEKQLARKLRGWKTPETRFIVMRDQDLADCKTVKQNLQAICKKAGNRTVLVRIVCRELESWYLADLKAVESGLRVSNLLRLQNKGRYRDPDTIVQPSQELKKITHKLYQKIKGSRMIGPYLALDNKRSASFKNFVKGIQKMIITWSKLLPLYCVKKVYKVLGKNLWKSITTRLATGVLGEPWRPLAA